MVAGDSDPRSQLHLPPGFRFYPTDEELVVQYLCRKIAGHDFELPIIGEVDLYKFNAWDLPNEALFGDKEWYFFSPRERKYPNGTRPNRVAGGGYWKATGTDKIIKTKGRKVVGIKKALVFYVGKAPKGCKTNWIMHEYRISPPWPVKSTGSTKLDDWVLCKIYRKNSRSAAIDGGGGSISPSSSCSHHDGALDLDSLPAINDMSFDLPPLGSTTEEDKKLSIPRSESGYCFDWLSIDGQTAAAAASTPMKMEIPGYGNDVLGPVTIHHGCLTLTGSLDPFWAHYPAHNYGFGFPL